MRKLLYQELIEVRKTEEEAKILPKHPISLILHNIRSSYNVGSIFRTADSANIQEIILCGYTPTPPRPEIDKTALGATSTVSWQYIQSTADAIAMQKAKGETVFALELTTNSINYDEIPKSAFPITIVLGNEISGVDDDLLELCDFAIEIPMYGIKHSLNVAVATGIAIYEATQIYLSK